MAANSRAFIPPCSMNQTITSANFNAMDVNGAQSVNRNSTHSGWRRQPLLPTAQYNSSGARLYSAAFGALLCTNNVGSANIPLLGLPHGHKLISAKVQFLPAGAHGGQPTNLPQIDLYKFDSAATSLRQATYTWVDIATYEAGFTLTTLALSPGETIDLSAYSYALRIAMESGTNSVSGMYILDCQVNCTVDPSYGTAGGPDFSFWI